MDLVADDPREAIDDVFLVLRDGMELSVEEIKRALRRLEVAGLASVAQVDPMAFDFKGDLRQFPFPENKGGEFQVTLSNELDEPVTVRLQASGVDLGEAQIVWEARDQEPTIASETVVPCGR